MVFREFCCYFYPTWPLSQTKLIDFAVVILLSHDFDSTLDGKYMLPYYSHNWEEKPLYVSLKHRHSK